MMAAVVRVVVRVGVVRVEVVRAEERAGVTVATGKGVARMAVTVAARAAAARAMAAAVRVRTAAAALGKLRLCHRRHRR